VPIIVTGARAAVAAGQMLGPYEIVAPLGSGGMGEVYRARDARLGRDVAVEVIRAAGESSPEWLRRFEDEVRAPPPRLD
jgi:serine/threonine protein kinase